MKKKGADVAKAKKKSAAKLKKASPAKSKKKVVKPSKVASKAKTKVRAQEKKKSKSTSTSKAKIIDISLFVTPLDDRLVVQLNQSEKVTPGGLIIPDTVSDVSGHHEGTVLATGRGHRDNKGRLRPMDVRQGNKILFSSMTGSKLHYQGTDLIILRETDVMGVID